MGIINKDNEIWQLYEKCLERHRLSGICEETEQAYDFFEGNQWKGLEAGNENLPVYNLIAPVVRYKVAMIAMNSLNITYSIAGASSRVKRIASMLSRRALNSWERLKMDAKSWEVIKSAAISGDSYAYFYNGNGDCQIIDRTDVFLADEQQPDIQRQPYILIRELRQVDKVRQAAVRNGISEREATAISADSRPDLKEKDDKCVCILKLELKENGDLHFSRATKGIVYQSVQVIEGLGVYPIAAYVVCRKRGSARGVGEVKPLICNQIEINRNLARRLINSKLTAFSRLVYSADRIANPKSLSEVGTAIEVESGGVSAITDIINYLTPSPMSPDAATLSNEMLYTTRELSGVGDAMMGNVDPEKASGVAIIAVRDQQALPVNEQTAAFRQFAEDIARIWYRLWIAYNPEGIYDQHSGEVIKVEELIGLEPDIRVDISSANPFSKYARDQALEGLFKMGAITFEEYVEALDDDSAVPKAKLEEIIKQRRENDGMTKDPDQTEASPEEIIRFIQEMEKE